MFTLTGGIYKVGDVAGNGHFNTNQGNHAESGNNSNIIDNGAAFTGVTKAGPGVWVLTGANAYTGTTLIKGGTLNITGTHTLNSPITFATDNDGIININTAGSVAAGAITWSGAVSGVLNLVNGTLLAGGDITSANATATGLIFNGGTLKANAAIVTISGNLPIVVLAGGGTIDNNASTITSSSHIGSTASPGTLNVTGGGTLQSPFGAAFTGAANIACASTTVRFVTTAANYSGVWTIGAGAQLDINNVGNFSFGGLSGGGTILNTGGQCCSHHHDHRNRREHLQRLHPTTCAFDGVRHWRDSQPHHWNADLYRNSHIQRPDDRHRRHTVLHGGQS